MKKLLQGRTRQNRDGKIFESIDSSFIPIGSTGGVPDENIEEPDKFGYCILLDEKYRITR